MKKKKMTFDEIVDEQAAAYATYAKETPFAFKGIFMGSHLPEAQIMGAAWNFKDQFTKGGVLQYSNIQRKPSSGLLLN